MKDLKPTETQIRRIAELGGTLKDDATREDAKKLIKLLFPNRAPTEGMLRCYVDEGGIPFEGLKRGELERLSNELLHKPALTMANLDRLYGKTPAHPYLLEWLMSFGYVLTGEITSGEAAKAIQTTKYEVSYLGFENAFLFGDDEHCNNPIEKVMRMLRKSSFSEWVYRKRELIDKHRRLLSAREKVLQPMIERVNAVKKKIEIEHGTLPEQWWKLLDCDHRGENSKVYHHNENVNNLEEIAATHEWERMVFWLAFTGVNMCSYETDWELGADFGDIPAHAKKLAKTALAIKPATEDEVAVVLSALDAEQSDWELVNPAQHFVEMRINKQKQNNWKTTMPATGQSKVGHTRIRAPRVDYSKDFADYMLKLSIDDKAK